MTIGAECVPLRLEGRPMEVGYAHGRSVRQTLRTNLEAYIDGLTRSGMLDVEKMRRDCMPWFETVPPHFREEMEGVACGAEIALDDMVQWLYGSAYAADGCTSVVAAIEGRTWIAHNNDWHDFGSHRWTAAVVRHVKGRIPSLTFGLQGDVCAVVGINRDRLWLNMNGLLTTDAPRPHVPVMPYPFLIREALETCGTLSEVGALVEAWDRDAGMAIYAVDGKTDEAALFECGLGASLRRDPVDGRTLLSCSRDRNLREVAHDGGAMQDGRILGSNTRERVDRLQSLLVGKPIADPPADLIAVLADPVIEERSATIYANVACPSEAKLWFGRGGPPAASAGTWHRVEWPWS
jgi:hypothetical protein